MVVPQVMEEMRQNQLRKIVLSIMPIWCVPAVKLQIGSAICAGVGVMHPAVVGVVASMLRGQLGQMIVNHHPTKCLSILV